MAAIQLLTAVVLNLVQFWQTSGQGKNRAFLVTIKYLVVMSTCFICCNSTTLAFNIPFNNEEINKTP